MPGSDGVRGRERWITSLIPIRSMYCMFTYIWLIFRVNVGIYHTWILWDWNDKTTQLVFCDSNVTYKSYNVNCKPKDTFSFVWFCCLFPFGGLWLYCCAIVVSSVSPLTPWRDSVSSHLLTLLIHSYAVCYRLCLLLSLQVSCIGIFIKSIRCPLLPWKHGSAKKS